MYSFHPSAKIVRATWAAILFAAFAADTAGAQQGAGSAAQALTNWLGCEYCERGELAEVTRYGQAIVPDLIAVLQQGPPSQARDDLTRALGARYDQLVEQSKKNRHAPIAVTKENFVEFYRSIVDTQHRVRAALALATIGGDRARAALE